MIVIIFVPILIFMSVTISYCAPCFLCRLNPHLHWQAPLEVLVLAFPFALNATAAAIGHMIALKHPTEMPLHGENRTNTRRDVEYAKDLTEMHGTRRTNA